MTNELLDQLDTERDYGDRSYDEVVEAVGRGELRLEAGRNLPVIREAATNRAVKGTGQPSLRSDSDVVRWSRRDFNEAQRLAERARLRGRAILPEPIEG